jgi:hypothetical protein
MMVRRSMTPALKFGGNVICSRRMSQGGKQIGHYLPYTDVIVTNGYANIASHISQKRGENWIKEWKQKHEEISGNI